MTERTDGAVVLSCGIEDFERRLAELEAQMRFIRTVLVPALEAAQARLLALEELTRRLRTYG